MLEMLVKFDVDYEDLRKKHLPRGRSDFNRFHFSSKRKRMSTIIENINGDTEYGYDKRIHLKGASEYILASCNYCLIDGLK